MYEKRYCQRCEKIEVYGKFKYCSKCIKIKKAENSARYRQQSKGKEKSSEKICKVCGKLFKPKDWREKTCSPKCHHKNKILLQREVQKRHLERERKNPKLVAKIDFKGKEINLKYIRKLGCAGCVFNGGYKDLNCCMSKYMIMQKNCASRIYKPFDKEDLKKLKPHKIKPPKQYKDYDYARQDYGTIELLGSELKYY